MNSISTKQTIDNYYPKVKIKGNVCFLKQLNRTDLNSMNINENRFMNLNLFPSISTKRKSEHNIRISRQKTNREVFKVNKISTLTYYPKIDLVRERSPKGAIVFERMTKRKDLFINNNSQDWNLKENCHQCYSSTNTIKSIPNFNKYPAYKKEFPRYLQVKYLLINRVEMVRSE